MIETAKGGTADLNTLREYAMNMLDYKAKFLTFTGVPMAAKMLEMYMEALGTMENLEQFIALTEAATMYFNRHHMWVDLIIPWGVFNGFSKKNFEKYL